MRAATVDPLLAVDISLGLAADREEQWYLAPVLIATVRYWPNEERWFVGPEFRVSPVVNGQGNPGGSGILFAVGSSFGRAPRAPIVRDSMGTEEFP